MHFGLKSTTSTGAHAVFDPEVVLQVINDPDIDRAVGSALEDSAKRGDVLLYSDGANGTVTFRVYLGEQPDEGVSALAAHTKHGLLLHVPSGNIFASGTECLTRRSREQVSTERFESAAQRHGEKVSIPRGDYLVDAFEVQRPQWKPSYLDHLFKGVSCLGCSATVIGSLVALAIPVSAALRGMNLAWIVIYWGVTLAVFWIALILFHGGMELRPAFRRFRRQLQESRERVPFDAVLVLRPIPGDIALASLRGDCFGRGFAYRPVRSES